MRYIICYDISENPVRARIEQDAFSHPAVRPLLVREIIRRKMKGQIALLRTYAKRRGVEELTRLADAVKLHLAAKRKPSGFFCVPFQCADNVVK